MSVELPKKCTYLSLECKEKLAQYEAKLKSAIAWQGFCCQECLIAMQKVVYRNNQGTLDFREINSRDWTKYGAENDPSHKGRNDHLA